MTETDFTEITKLSERFYQNPRSKIFVHLADMYRKNNMIDEALEVLKTGLRYHPNYPLAHLIRGKCFFNKAMFAQAKGSFEKALELDPQNLMALRMLAQICELLQDEEGQIIAYRTILGIDPSDEVAKRKFDQLVSSERERPLYTKEEAEEYERHHDISKALEAYEYLLFLDPSDFSLQEKINALRQQLEAPTSQETKLRVEEMREEEMPEPSNPDIEAEQESVEPVIEATPSEEVPESVNDTARERKIKLHAAAQDDETQKQILDEEPREKADGEEPIPARQKSKPKESEKGESHRVAEYFKPFQYMLASFFDRFNPPPIDRGERPFDLQGTINKFFRRKNIFFYVALPMFLIVLIVQSTKPYTPIYRATFDIGMSQERPVEGMFSAYREAPTLQIGTVTQRVISSLLSVSLAEEVVDTLSLYVHIEEGALDIRIESKILRKFDTPIGPIIIEVSGRRCKVFKEGPVVLIYEGFLNEYIDLDYVSIRIVPLVAIPEGKTYELTIYPKENMALALRNSLSIKVLDVDKVEQQTGSTGIPFSGEGLSQELVSAKSIYPGFNMIGILRINVHWGNPRDAYKIAEVLSKQIIRENIREKSLQYTQSETFIDSQLTIYQNHLGNLEEEIRQFKGGKQITDLKASTQALISQVSDLESKRSQLQIEQQILHELIDYLATAGATDIMPNFAPTLLSDPVLQNFYSQLLQTEADLKGLLKEYSTSHPKVIETRAKLDGLKEQIKEEVGKRTSTIKTEISSVTNQIQILQRRLQNVPQDEILLARLERDKETAVKLYTFFAEKREEARVQEAGITSDLRIINPPLVSSGPVNARTPVSTFFLAIFLSIIAGAVAVFIVDFVDTTITDPDIAKEKIGLPIFGLIPFIEDEKVKHEKAPWFERFKFLLELFKMEKQAEKLKVVSEDFSAAEFEAFRKLSINLDFAHPEQYYRILYVTSAGPEEGKTFITLNLGVVLSAMRKKVIIIDTDFRKKSGHLTDVARLKKEIGLFDLLKGEARLDDIIIPFSADRESSRPNHLSSLALIPVGNIPPNPFVFLESEKMMNLVKQLKKQYEYVIIDGVPILLFADATYLANFADGVLLTARYGKTGYKELETARDILLTAKSNVIGLVLNNIPKTRGSYYYQLYHKHYSKYYKREEHSP